MRFALKYFFYLMKSSSFCRNCFYDDNNDVKNNKSLDDHADNPDNQCWIHFTELFKSIMTSVGETFSNTLEKACHIC